MRQSQVGLPRVPGRGRDPGRRRVHRIASGARTVPAVPVPAARAAARPGTGATPGPGGGSNLPPPTAGQPGRDHQPGGPAAPAAADAARVQQHHPRPAGRQAPASRGGGFSVDIPGTAGFVNGAKITSSVDAKQFVDASERLATAAAARLGELLPGGCFPAPAAANAQDDCARQFIKQFGLRAYRRPVTGAEETDMFDFYRALRGARGRRQLPGRHQGADRRHHPDAAVPVSLGAGRGADQGRAAVPPEQLGDRLAAVVLPVGLDARRRRCSPPPRTASCRTWIASPRKPGAC